LIRYCDPNTIGISGFNMQAVAATQKILPFKRADGSPRRVLYAEDQTSSRIVTTAMLKRMGFEVDAVEDGELALQHARKENYDVILLDIEMPVMDGVTAARSIRSELKHCDGTPILALSAFLADSTEQSIWRDAFDSALPKPANTNELHRALTNAMGFKDRNAASIVMLPAQTSPEDVIKTLRNSLSHGAWTRLQATAADEMRHLALAMSANVEAGDEDTLRKCSYNMKGLALNFGAVEIAEVATNFVTEKSDAAMLALLGAINTWEKS
jgi:CheY-like chemotaxis protein